MLPRQPGYRNIPRLANGHVVGRDRRRMDLFPVRPITTAERAGPEGGDFTFGIGVPCRDEAQNIGRLLESLCRRWPEGRVPTRIVVVSDGSRDGSDDIVRSVAGNSPVPVQLVSLSEPAGKPAAINRILAELRDVDVVLLVSADVIPLGDCLLQLLDALEQPDVGVAAGRVMPEGPENNLAARVSRLLWDLHHQIVLDEPKSTEVTAHRNVLAHIDQDTIVDEAEIDCAMSRAGYRIAYVPQALVRTMSPLSLGDYVRQRLRVTSGHLALARAKGHRVSTLSTRSRLRALFRVARSGRLPLGTLLVAAVLETGIYGAALALGTRKSRDGTWSRIESAKRPVRPER